MMTIKQEYSPKELGIDLLCDLAGAILFNIGIYNFAVNAEFAPVGVSGIALILRFLFGLPMGITSIVLNIPIVLVSYRLLGRSFLLRSMKSMIIFALVQDYVVPYLPVYQGNPLYASACTGIFSGLGLTIVYLRNCSTGGTDFLVMAIRKIFPHLTIGQISLVVDAVVIIAGGLVFRNLDAVILGMLSTIVTTMVIDKIMYGLGAGKLVFVVTSHAEEAAQRIEENTGRGCTFLQGQGSYSLDEKKVIMCACNNSQVVPIRRAIHETDKDAFLIITDSNEVYGEGFKAIGGQL
ncbi:YitT family protein [Lacrimispora celerecrescens]|uniref:Membrane protein n=1 Tax=Lacrimispora celerecrescens TaxID=29354 RepID=A0A084JPI2_9FIRM|nr:YitT family protein [Lacrimispora celerecrescens]KEZ90866.1 membrane protein [Lacrimispora celerecrescens]